MQGQYRGDFTRDTFNRFKHFTRVLMQQGRVHLEADWNEQAAILLHYLQALAADLIGQHAGSGDSFKIQPIGAPNDFSIDAGHYYVDGILCELEATPIRVSVQTPPTKPQALRVLADDLEFQPGQYVEVLSDLVPVQAKISSLDPVQRTLTLDRTVPGAIAIRRITTYLRQPDYPVPDNQKLENGQTYQVYLDVWERHITYVEDDSIREVALSGPDTAARAKVVWQVKVTKDPSFSSEACATVSELTQKFQPYNRGWLRAKAKEKSASTDPCIIPPDSKYRGAENQLYRVEIHRPGSAWDGKADTLDSAKKNAATFKWSRENGSVVFPILDLATDSAAGTTTVTLENLGRDDRFGLAEGDWVEIVDDDYVLQNSAGNLLQVQAIDRTSMTVTLTGTPDPNVGNDPTKHPLLRRWNQKQGERAEGGLQLGTDGAALIVEDGGVNWLSLEDGVQIQFQKPKRPASQSYRTGDYWLIPARTATGDVEWPTITDRHGNLIPLLLPPHGVEHHYAPLAIINVDESGNVTRSKDCRKVLTLAGHPAV
jgi:hypothetical protein